MPDILAIPTPPPIAPVARSKAHGCGCFSGTRALIVVVPYVSKRKVLGKQRGGSQKVGVVEAVQAIEVVQAVDVVQTAKAVEAVKLVEVATVSAGSIQFVPSTSSVPSVPPVRSAEAPPLRTPVKILDAPRSVQKVNTVAEDRDGIVAAKQNRFGMRNKDLVRREAKGTAKVIRAAEYPVSTSAEELRDCFLRGMSEKYRLVTKSSARGIGATEDAGEVIVSIVPLSEVATQADSELSGTQLRDLRISSRIAKWSSGSRKFGTSGDSSTDITAQAVVEDGLSLKTTASSQSVATADPRDNVLSAKKQRYALTARSDSFGSLEVRTTSSLPSTSRTAPAKSQDEPLTATELRDLRLKKAAEKYGGSFG